MRSIAILFVACLTVTSAGAAVTITSVSDHASLEASARKSNSEVMRRALVEVVTPVRGPVRQIDASIVAWRIETVGTRVEVTASLRIAICDERGQLLSIVSGRATVSAPWRRIREAQLRELRWQAVESAVDSAAEHLRSQLAQPAV